MGNQNISLNIGWLYCFKRGNTFVFLNKKDEIIKEFNSYAEAEKYANKNIHLICKDQKATSECTERKPSR